MESHVVRASSEALGLLRAWFVEGSVARIHPNFTLLGAEDAGPGVLRFGWRSSDRLYLQEFDIRELARKCGIDIRSEDAGRAVAVWIYDDVFEPEDAEPLSPDDARAAWISHGTEPVWLRRSRPA